MFSPTVSIPQSCFGVFGFCSDLKMVNFFNVLASPLILVNDVLKCLNIIRRFVPRLFCCLDLAGSTLTRRWHGTRAFPKQMLI